jgi:hypothetical protein
MDNPICVAHKISCGGQINLCVETKSPRRLPGWIVTCCSRFRVGNDLAAYSRVLAGHSHQLEAATNRSDSSIGICQQKSTPLAAHPAAHYFDPRGLNRSSGGINMLNFVVLFSLMFTADPASELQKLMDEGVKIQQAEVEKQTDLIKQMKKGLVRKSIAPSGVARDNNGKFFFNSIDAKTKEIEAAEAKLKNLQSKKYIGPELNIGKLKLGDVGRLRDSEFKHELVAKVVFVGPDGIVIRSSNDKRMLAVKMNTDGITTDSYIRLTEDYMVIGTKTFTLVSGASQTIFEVKPFKWPE